ncbi:phosphopyruvate hydratase [Patescibacteria group bacterium]|nr:phosphopyruvate hydratase [Patescibacteria group bacterium]
MKIKSIKAYEILDSRGQPTVTAITALADGSRGEASVPSGASTGSYEAMELRDNDPQRYRGLGVLKAIGNITDKIAPVLVGQEAADQQKIDALMIKLDNTDNKGNLGANAILAVSLSAARAQAAAEKKPLYEYLAQFNPSHRGDYLMPVPMMNIMNGGKHANWATDIQEYMILPVGARSITAAVRMCSEIYLQLKEVLKAGGYSINIGDEGGFAPDLAANEEPFKLISEAVHKAGYKAGQEVAFGIDAAATEFFKAGKYLLKKEGREVDSSELAAFYQNLINKYPIVSLEDIFSEDDWAGFQNFTQASKNQVQIVGDDLYVTNPARLKRGLQEKTTNSILIKLNQIGTLSETIEVILTAQKNRWTAVISHRSGETADDFIADLAVAMGAGQLKTGAPCRGERTAKYNRLMRIEKEQAGRTTYYKFPF